VLLLTYSIAYLGLVTSGISLNPSLRNSGYKRYKKGNRGRKGKSFGNSESTPDVCKARS